MLFSVYLDCLSILGADPAERSSGLVGPLRAGATQAAHVVSAELVCKLAPSKTAVVATTEQVATDIAKALSLDTGHPIHPLDSGILLGCEVRMGGGWRGQGGRGGQNLGF